MSRIAEALNSINEKNAILSQTRQTQIPKLTKGLLKSILKGIDTGKVKRLLADELGVTVGLINDVVQEFEIETPYDARNVLSTMEDEFISFKEGEYKAGEQEVIKPMVEFNTKPVKQKPIEGVVYFKPNFNKAKTDVNLDKGVRKRRKLDTIDMTDFERDMEFGFSRLRTIYGEETKYGLNDKDIQDLVLSIEPDILKRDSEYFNGKEIEG